MKKVCKKIMPKLGAQKGVQKRAKGRKREWRVEKVRPGRNLGHAGRGEGGLRRLWGAPGSQRRPKGHQKSSYPPRPFSNRLPDGGPDGSPQSPGPSWDQFGIVFNAIFGNICSYISTLFVSFVHVFGHSFYTVFRYSFWDALYYIFHICF